MIFLQDSFHMSNKWLSYLCECDLIEIFIYFLEIVSFIKCYFVFYLKVENLVKLMSQKKLKYNKANESIKFNKAKVK